MKSKNEKALKDFIKYCEEHPGERFWQALRNWAKVNFIYISNSNFEEWASCQDTFYFEGKNK